MLYRVPTIINLLLRLPTPVLFLAASLLYLAASPVALQAQYHVDSWTTVAGLPQNSVYSILQTRDGYVWFTTLDGLVRYDGVRFTVFNRGNGGGGINSLSGDRFEALAGQSGARLPRCIDLSPAGACWYQDAVGVHKALHGNSATYPLFRLEPNKVAFRIFEDRDGAAWVTWRSGGVSVIKPDSSSTSYDAKAGLPALAVSAISQDHNGRLWFGTIGGGLLSFNGQRFVTHLEPGVKAGTDDIRVIYEDRESTLWLGKRAAGLAKLVRQIVTVRTKADGLSGNNVYPVLEDHSGNLWVGGRLSHYRGCARQVLGQFEPRHLSLE